jgi:anthranilate phosphoribosyltransferase
MVASLLHRVEDGKILTRAEAEQAMEEILSGSMQTPEIVRLLRAMNGRPVQTQELVGFAGVMRRHAAPVFSDENQRPDNLVDTCGTGGDGCETFNISTAAAIVASAAGACVAKHGNRASSSRCGSADVLEALGVRVDIPLQRSGEALRKIGLAFFFAPLAHAATRYAAAARKEIGQRTIFNLLGPLTNPAGAHFQVVGVYSAAVLELVAETLKELGIQRAFVVHGADGLDEISLSRETHVIELRAGQTRRFTVTPEDFDMKRAPLETLRGGSAHDNAALIARMLDGEAGAQRNITVINAAAALVTFGTAQDFRDGAKMAAEVITSGAAKTKLAALLTFTNST